MGCILKNITIHSNSTAFTGHITVDGENIISVSPSFSPAEGFEIIDCTGLDAFPGLADVHVHLREPGFCYKETIKSGTLAAAHGGFTAVCSMPNLSPVPDSLEHLKEELCAIEKDALIDVIPYGAITVDEKGENLSDFDAMAEHVAAFSDDGKGVQNQGMMERAMVKARAFGKVIAAHCEDEALLFGGKIHDGSYAKAHGIPGISSESEWRPIERDVAIAEKTGCAYHVCHISTKESVEIIRRAKARGINVTCETAPHYLVFAQEDLQDDGRFRMNPPIREKEDRQALIDGIIDGTVDMIATDHAPHSAEEKSHGIAGSLNGVVGLETSFAAVYTHLVKTGLITPEHLVKIMCTNPRERFALGGGVIAPGERADIAVFDLNAEYTVSPEEFKSAGKSSPFTGERLFGKCRMTICGGKTVWRDI